MPKSTTDSESGGYLMRKIIGPVVVLCVLVAVLPSVVSARTVDCSSTFKAHGTRFAVRILRGSELTCATAIHVLHAFATGHGTRQPTVNGHPQAWTLPGGWTCSKGSTASSCIRGGNSSQNATDYISAYKVVRAG